MSSTSTTIAQLIMHPAHLLSYKDDLSSAQHRLDAASRNQPELISEPVSTPTNKPFLIFYLPWEIRQQIYTFYFASLPTQSITCPNARLPHHTLTPLFLASPCLALDLSSTFYYRNATFSFLCPEALKIFAKTLGSSPILSSGTKPEKDEETKEIRTEDRAKDVRKIKILYGRFDQPTRDWLHLLMENFSSVEEVTFSVERKGSCRVGQMCFGNWWSCVRDAVREGLAPAGKGRKVKMRAEDGEWGIDEIFYC